MNVSAAVARLGCRSAFIAKAGGDAFMAGFSTKLVKDKDWKEQLEFSTLQQCLEYANVAGALKATKQAVIPALPYTRDVDNFIKS